MSGERTRVLTWSAPTPAPLAMTGMAAVLAAVDGTLPPPPVASLVGVSMTHAEPGLVRLTLQPAEFHYNPIGMVHGGVAATMLETALAAAVRTTLPPGRACVTIEIKVNYVRALSPAAGAVVAEGRVVHAGRQVALAEGRVTDAAGRLYATATSTCLLQDAAPPPERTAEIARRRVVDWTDPLANARRIAGMGGLEALHDARIEPPIMRLLGIEMGAIEPGRVSMSLPPGEHLFSQFGVVHGGMTATLLDSVMGCAVHSTLPAGRGYTTLELKITFLRAITAASGLITGTGQVLHEGGRMATAEARALDAAGRLCATGTTTCLLFDARTPS
jgi:uncharacterized protein (TIGR00369 family)